MPIQAEGATRKLADPFDFGGGHINPDKAADPGLVYHVDATDYTKFFHCTLGSKDLCQTDAAELYRLNLPSIAVPNLKGSVTVLRPDGHQRRASGCDLPGGGRSAGRGGYVRGDNNVPGDVQGKAMGAGWLHLWQPGMVGW
jgi:hypothetical protein